MQTHVGVDLHQRFCYLTALDARGRRLKQSHSPRRHSSYEWRRGCPALFVNRLRTVFYSCSLDSPERGPCWRKPAVGRRQTVTNLVHRLGHFARKSTEVDLARGLRGYISVNRRPSPGICLAAGLCGCRGRSQGIPPDSAALWMTSLDIDRLDEVSRR